MLFLSLLCQSAVDRGLSVKPGPGHLGHWQTVQILIRCCRMQHLIRVCTVCLNYSKLRVKQNSLWSLFMTIFPAYAQRQSVHQCCLYFDFFFVPEHFLQVFIGTALDIFCYFFHNKAFYWYSLESSWDKTSKYPQKFFTRNSNTFRLKKKKKEKKKNTRKHLTRELWLYEKPFRYVDRIMLRWEKWKHILTANDFLCL